MRITDPSKATMVFARDPNRWILSFRDQGMYFSMPLISPSSVGAVREAQQEYSLAGRVQVYGEEIPYYRHQ